MIFEIERASNWGDGVDKPPCDKAYKTEITLTNGWNETKTVKIYVVNIDTLEELMQFVEREGKIVVYPARNATPQISIYDDWIE